CAGLSALSDIEYPCGDAALVGDLYEGEGGPGALAGTAWVHDGHVPGVVYPGDVGVSVEDQPGLGEVPGIQQRVQGILHGVGVAVRGEHADRPGEKAHA